MARVLEQQVRPEEVVPRPLELEHGDRGDGRARERQHHAPERLEEAGPVELGRLLEVARDRQEVLAHEEEGARAHHLDRPVARIRVDEVPVREREVRQHRVDGDEPQLVRDHHRPEDDEEEDVAAREVEAREGVAAEAGEEDGGHRDRDREPDAVEEEAQEVVVGQRLAIPLERPRVRPEREVDRVGARLEGRRERPQERDEEDERDRDERDVRERRANALRPRAAGDVERLDRSRARRDRRLVRHQCAPRRP